jgi:fimbrial chaperone protein
MKWMPSTLALALMLLPLPAAASNFTVTPIEVNLSASATSGLVTLRNLSKASLRFEITVFRWTESERGEMILQPSSEVTFFPRLIELAAGASRNIRVGVNAGVARDVEQSFRLFVEELPDQSAPTANAVAIRTKLGIPVFVRPAKPARAAAIDAVTVERGRVLTRVRNTGNLHINVQNVVVSGRSASNGAAFSRTAPGWYVLPGATRTFEVPLDASECAAATSVAVEVFGHNASIKGSSPVTAAACASR